MLGKIYGLTGAGLVVSAIASLMCLTMPFGLVTSLVGLVVALALCAGVCFTRGALSAGIFLVLAAVMGAVSGPTINHYLTTHFMLIPIAAVITGGIFASLSAYVYKTGKDFTFMGGMLFVALLGLVLASVVALFVPGMQVLVSFVGVLIFSGYILYDTSNIMQKNFDEDQYAQMALQLYLDIFNLFFDILRTLSWFNGSD